MIEQVGRNIMRKTILKWIAVISMFTIATAALTVMSSSSANAASVKMKVTAPNTDKLNMRKGPGVKYSTIRKLNYNTVVTRTKVSGSWSKITYKGESGWVSTKYLRKVAIKSATFPLDNFTIVVDAGHGGTDDGAFYYNTSEKSVNLKAAKELKKQLEYEGAEVVMTRSTDKTLSLPGRVKISKKIKPDAYISLHHNASKTGNKTDKGYLVLYTKSKEKAFTKAVYSGMKSVLSTKTTVPYEGYRYQNLHVLRENPYIGTLVEYGYMSTPSELKKINKDSYRKYVAQGIVKGVINYFD